MQALEPYFPNENIDTDKSQLDLDEYYYIESKLKDESFKKDLKSNETYATLSKSEWEAITLYIVFAFEKIEESEDNSKAD